MKTSGKERKKIKKQKRVFRSPAEVVIFDSAYVETKEHPVAKNAQWLMALGMLFGLDGILTGSFASAFGVDVQWPVLVPFLLAFCGFFTWFFLFEKLKGFRILAGLLLTAVYGGVCFAFQGQIIRGFYRVGIQVIRQVNQTYDGNLALKGSGSVLEGTIFLLAVLFPVTEVLGASVVRRPRVLPVLAVLFPVLAMTGIAGGSPSVLWLFLILMGLIVLIAAAGNHLPGFRTALAAGLLALTVSVPSWYLVRPLLEIPAAKLSKKAEKVEMRLMQSLYQILPQISGGRLNLSLEGIGGGVEDGSLGEIDGYFFTGVEALKVTSEQKPMETVYLKGYIGQEYTGTSYEIGSEKSFANVSSSWKTEGNSSIYIQNLPFLRMMYYENYVGNEEDGELVTTSNTITVENLNANSKYTYVPYYAFISDNYQIYGGDGYVGGQTIQDDVFPCYWRSSYQEAMEARREDEDEGGVLDGVEVSYRVYCSQHDLEVPEKGLERLKEECAAATEEEKWNQNTTGSSSLPLWARADEIEEIRQYVLKRLLSECEYNLDADALPEGEDFIEYFLYESKEGYSMHFAAAATMMFRMLGVPARYVVGYVAPKEVFTADENGNYTAILEDDNAHAWTEIYQPFLGWTPVEVTPGMEAEAYGDLYMEETESESEIETEKVQEEVRESALAGVKNWFTGTFLPWLKRNLDTILLGGQVLLTAGAAFWVLWHVWRQRRQRLGIGKEPDGQIQALYRSLYRVLVLAGMPEGYTIALSGRGNSGEQDVFAWLASNAAWKDEKKMLENAAGQDEKEMTANAAGLNEKEMTANAAGLNAKELDKMRQMILRSHYGVGAAEQDEAEQMLALYRKCWKILRRRIPVGKRGAYLWRG